MHYHENIKTNPMDQQLPHSPTGVTLPYINPQSSSHFEPINPLPVQFKSLLPGQEGCVFFSGHLNVRKYHYALVR
jgi:hypothetical protein